jgi:hypothetical protein
MEIQKGGGRRQEGGGKRRREGAHIRREREEEADAEEQGKNKERAGEVGAAVKQMAMSCLLYTVYSVPASLPGFLSSS